MDSGSIGGISRLVQEKDLPYINFKVSLILKCVLSSCVIVLFRKTVSLVLILY